MNINTPQTPKFRKKIAEYIKSGEKFISLGLGEPEIETPDFIKEAAYKALLDGYTRYSSPNGLEPLREAISRKLKIENNIDSTPEKIIITPGGKNALFISCLGLVEDGSEVINLTPGYISNLPILHLSSRNINIKNIPLNRYDYSINRTELERNITKKTKLLLINFPNNPTGKILSEDDADFLAELVEDKNLLIVSDEVYEKFVYTKKHISIGSYEKIKNKVITINSFSKTYFMTGWRIGYLNANPDIIKELTKINLHINTNTAAFTQMAAYTAMTHENSFLQDYLEKLKCRRDKYISILKGIEAHPFHPEGGLFAFLNISRTGLTSDEFAEQLLEEEKVAVSPGINFGEEYDGFCRISFACETSLFEEAVSRIKRFFEKV